MRRNGKAKCSHKLCSLFDRNYCNLLSVLGCTLSSSSEASSRKTVQLRFGSPELNFWTVANLGSGIFQSRRWNLVPKFASSASATLLKLKKRISTNQLFDAWVHSTLYRPLNYFFVKHPVYVSSSTSCCTEGNSLEDSRIST